MDLRYLAYFVEVAKQGSFTRAAESLNLTQPTLSKMIKNLEEELGVTLFDRSTKHIVLTDIGQIALCHAESVLQSSRDLIAALDDAAHLKRGNITVGLPPVIGSLFFPRIIAEFRRLYPDITIQLTEDGAKRILQHVEHGNIDLGVVVAPIESTQFHVQSFRTEDLALIVHSSHPMATRTDLTLRELHHEPFILFREDFALHDHIYRACREVGFQPNVVYESSQWDFIAEMVAANMGVSILPRTICKKIVNRDVKTLNIIHPVLPWELVVVWKKSKYTSYATQAFLQHMKRS